MNFSGISDKSQIGRLLRYPLRLIPDGMVLPILQGKLKGWQWITGSSVSGCWLGSYEYSKQHAFAEKVSTGQVVFDLGAHVGFYTLLAAELVGHNGHVIAFEPLPRNLDFLKQHLLLNDCNNVTVIEQAVSDYSGIATFEAQPSQGYAGHIGISGQLQVSVVTLDELTMFPGGLPIPQVIKIDIEGAEFAALTGASKLLAAFHPVIFLATHGQQVHHQCCDLLAGIGYSLRALDGRSVKETDEIVAEFLLA